MPDRLLSLSAEASKGDTRPLAHKSEVADDPEAVVHHSTCGADLEIVHAHEGNPGPTIK